MVANAQRAVPAEGPAHKAQIISFIIDAIVEDSPEIYQLSQQDELLLNVLYQELRFLHEAICICIHTVAGLAVSSHI